MPHIVYRAIEVEEVKKIEQPIIQEISKIVNCPPNQFTTEWTPTLFISHGQENSGGYPFVTINWFKRSSDQQTEVAKVITQYILELGYSDVCVYFNELEPSAYYENGVHF